MSLFLPHFSPKAHLADPLSLLADKAVDFAQEKMGQGQQSDENAVEQQKDEVISDMIRDKYKGFTGNGECMQLLSAIISSLSRFFSGLPLGSAHQTSP